MQEITLTSSERLELKRIHRLTQKPKVCDKIKAVLMKADGYSTKEIAEVLLLDDDTIHQWIDYFLKRKTVNDWLGYRYVGYDGKLTCSELEQVKNYVSENVISDSKQVIAFIKTTFSKQYSLSGIVDLLKRLGFVYKKTTLIPSKYDPELQEKFKAAYEELEKNLGEKETILFMDGVHPQHNTTCTNAWIQKGQAKEIKSNTGRQRINLNGVYNPVTQEVITHESDTINADAILDSLKEIETFYATKDKIYIILDNARYYRNQIITEHLTTSKIVFMFLPPYSPNLNLIERLWKFMRKKIINNQYYETFKEFKSEIDSFFKGLPSKRHELRQFIGTKLHLLQAV